MTKELSSIILSEGTTAEEYIASVPQEHQKENISAIYHLLQKSYPLNRGEIQSLVREHYAQKHQKYLLATTAKMSFFEQLFTHNKPKHEEPQQRNPIDIAQAERDINYIRVFTQALSNELEHDTELSEIESRDKASEILISTAKQNALYIPTEHFRDFGERKTRPSGESVVYKLGNTYTKVKDPFAKQAIKHSHAEDAIYEHVIHNILFPNTQYSIKGISDDCSDVRIVLTQKEVSAHRLPSNIQIDNYLKATLGLTQEDTYSWGNWLYSITDVNATSDNVLLGEDDKLYFIDPLIKLKKSAQEVIYHLLKDIRTQ